MTSTENSPKSVLARDVVATGTPGAHETPKRTLWTEDLALNEVFEAMMREVREEIEIVFGENIPASTEVTYGGGTEGEVSVEKFMRDGTTLISRNPVDVDGAANEKEYVLPNSTISKKGSEVSAFVNNEEDANQDQGPLDLYMVGLKYFAERLFRNIKFGEFKNHEIKVVATDAPDVDELKRTHVTIMNGLKNFIPPRVSSKGTK